MNAPLAMPISGTVELAPIEMDPRPCGLCGLTVDRHDMVDHGEGPEFYCADVSPDDMTLPELERRAELRRQEDIAGIFARWDIMDAEREAMAREPATRREPKPYRTPEATAAAFLYLVSLGEPERLEAWLAARPQDVPCLLELLESKS
jgi:hypothetical protein